MATQTGTLRAGYQLVIDSQGASVDYDVSVAGYAVDFKRIQQKNTLALGPYKVDCTYSVTANSGAPSIYKTKEGAAIEYAAGSAPSPGLFNLGDIAVISGSFASDVTEILLVCDMVKGSKAWTGNVYSENDAPANPSALGIPDGVTWVKLS